MAGENTSAPIPAIYFLMQAVEDRIEPIPPGDAIVRLMRNILFFVKDGELPCKLFQSACNFAATVPAFNLHFTPDTKVWEMLG